MLRHRTELEILLLVLDWVLELKFASPHTVTITSTNREMILSF